MLKRIYVGFVCCSRGIAVGLAVVVIVVVVGGFRSRGNCSPVTGFVDLDYKSTFAFVFVLLKMKDEKGRKKFFEIGFFFFFFRFFFLKKMIF